MKQIKYRKLTDVTPDDFIPILNEVDIRTHLVEHPLFTPQSVQMWLNEKIAMDFQVGCLVWFCSSFLLVV